MREVMQPGERGAKGDDEATATESESFGEVAAGKRVGTWHGAVADAALTAGKRVGPGYGDQDTAVAYAKSLPSSAVVVREADRFAIHELDDGSLYDFTMKGIKQMASRKHAWTNVTVEGAEVPGVVAFVTEDHYSIVAERPEGAEGAPSRFHQPDEPQLDANPLEAFAASGLSQIPDDQQFMSGFTVAMRELAMAGLARGEASARAASSSLEPESLGKDRTEIRQVARLVAQKNAAIATRVDRLRTLRGQARSLPAAAFGGMMGGGEQAELEVELHALATERKIVLARYPLLARVDADAFCAMPEDEQSRLLSGHAGQVLLDIERTRENIASGDLDLWGLPPLVQATSKAIGLGNPYRQQLLEKKQRDDRTKQLVTQIGLSAISFGLAILGAVTTGGLSLAFSVGALAVGGAQTLGETKDYFVNDAAANTALDPSQSLLDPAELGHAGVWLAVSWIGTGLDLFDCVKAIKMLRAGRSVAEVTEATHVAPELLAEAQPKLAKPAVPAPAHGAANDPAIMPAKPVRAAGVDTVTMLPKGTAAKGFDPDAASEFVDTTHAAVAEARKLATRPERVARLRAGVDALAQAIDVHAPKLVDAKILANGEFDKTTWTIKISEQLADQLPATIDSTLAHELRHAQQYWLVARRAAKQLSPAEITAKYGIHIDVATAAHARPMTDAEIASWGDVLDAWDESFTRGGEGFRYWQANARRSRAAADLAKNPELANHRDVTKALTRVRRMLHTVYRTAAHEDDAWAVGDMIEQLHKSLPARQAAAAATAKLEQQLLQARQTLLAQLAQARPQDHLHLQSLLRTIDRKLAAMRNP